MINLDLWKTAVHQRLTTLAQHLVDLKTEANRTGAGLVYGALATATLFPLVETARQAIGAGDYPLLMSLGGLATGIGGNLVAEQISRWKDRTAPELAQELAQKAQSDREWREALDKLLEHFEAPSRMVQAIVSEADKAWFARQLRTEIAQIGSRLTVKGDYIAATVGNNSGNVAIGKNITQIIHYYHPPDATVDEAALGQQIGAYLEWVCRRYGQVTLRGMQRQGQQAMELSLETVYVPLTATARQRSPAQGGDRRARREVDLELETTGAQGQIELNELLTQGDRLIVTGGPGSGKTTVLQHIAWTLATALLTDAPQLAQQKLGLTLADPEEALPLPVVLPLSVYALHRRRTAQTRSAQERTLAAVIADYLVEQQQGFADLLPDFFARVLQRGRHLMLLLDGLDEVPDEAERIRVREAIERLADGKEGLRMVVTCRIAAYAERTALGRDFHEVRVQPLDDAHVAALVQQAYGALYAQDPVLRARQTEELLGGIRDLEAERRRRLGESVARLIDSPLMVRLLLIVHLNERRFPQHRAEIYLRATDNLLWPDYGLEDAEALEQIRAFVGQSHEIHRDLVQQIAWEMHSQGDKQGREIDEDALRRLLRAAGQPDDLVRNFLQLTRLRGTLLEERLGLYRFFHLAFQEFMAARYLAEVVRGEGGVDAIVQLLLAKKLVLESWWREPILLVAGYLSMNARRNARTFLTSLAGGVGGGELSPDAQLAAAELAASAALEWFGEDEALRGELATRMVTLFENADLMNAADPRQRAAAGVALGRLGDPRPGVGVKDGLPDIAWSEVIESGPFLMGSDKRKDKLAVDRETPQFTCNLIDQPYRISRYPITVAQYRTFVEAGGYNLRQYWTKAGWQWRQKNAISDPETYGEPYQTPNHPQVGVSWYEAVAFCHWLSDQGKTIVRLPTEAEWERAARHTDGRIYPWGNEFDPKRCNMRDTEIGATSAVGVFPNGVAECSVLDMSGNVWEWCSTQWAEDYKEYAKRVKEELAGSAGRVWRGGSFVSNEYSVRCSYRGSVPDVRRNLCGFRVCLPRL